MQKQKKERLEGIARCRMNIVQIADWKIGVEGIKMIVARKWEGLQELNLFGNNLGDEGARVLTNCNWSGLLKLYMRGNSITNEGAFHLSRLKAQQITVLSISDNIITQDGLEPFRKSCFPKLRWLIVGFIVNSTIQKQLKQTMPCLVSSLVNLQFFYLKQINRQNQFTHLVRRYFAKD